ncbi:MAG: ZIP family metal transporter [Clostridiaceae bacterium]
MIYIIKIIVGSSISILGTMIGAAIGVIKENSKKSLVFLISLAAGIMFSIVVFELIPEGIKKIGRYKFILLMIMSALVMCFIDNISFKKKNKQEKKAFITSIALMLHNFPEGIIMGASFITGNSLGMKMCITIAIHDIPEGIAVAAPLCSSNYGKIKSVFYTFITAVPTIFGALVGALIGSVSEIFLGISLALASGIMLYVVLFEMLLEAYNNAKSFNFLFGNLIGILLGIVLSIY